MKRAEDSSAQFINTDDANICIAFFCSLSMLSRYIEPPQNKIAIKIIGVNSLKGKIRAD